MKFLFSLLLAAILLAEPPAAIQNNGAAPKAASIDFPTPSFNGLLFFIQRDPNTNTICYELNTDKNGKLNQNNPVKMYWIRYAEDGSRTELNYIQRTFAYGIKSKALSGESFELRSVAYPKHPLTLKKNEAGTYQVITKINQKDSLLKRIYIRIDGGTFWSPNVLYIEISGINLADGKPVTQRIIPK